MSQRLALALRNISFNQTMMRVKDPQKSLAFYQRHFDLKLAHQAHFSDFSLYFLVSLPTSTLTDDKKNAAYINAGEYGCTLELTHNHGTESDATFAYHNNTTAPFGFQQLGFAVPAGGLAATKASLEADGYASAAVSDSIFVTHDPDGYEVQVAEREASPDAAGISWHHSTLRVKDAQASLAFYKTMLGFTLLHEQRNDKERFTAYFLGTPAEPTPLSAASLRNQLATVVELRHYDGTESQPDFKYSNGNVEPHRGFGHLAVMVNDVYEACDAWEELGVSFQKKPNDGRMKGLAFILDPDGYWIEVIRRGGRVDGL
ncbi:Aste57867_24696 [Aphanomyces stellatus]|uniref:Aldoketomutase n=1 Tax=Aphanomyces stellatus TaxID=120398 RepID=A0A485LR90_9STRA|nr:hypothetical protein As57867_024618 [Aphanomyces stellatus]VFU01333.1 Aste57867_24696 [Aphanomyces stellatus]